MSKLINLTPHAINIVNGPTLPPSGDVARVSTKNVVSQVVDGIQIYVQKLGEIEGLPAPQEGTFLIVSAMVRLACPSRKDLLSPGTLIRNDDGQPIGCQGLISN